jgi:hypothetical protein
MVMMSTSFPREQQDSIESFYHAATEDTVSRAHSWDTQLVFKVTSGVGVKSKNPSMFGLPPMTEDQDIFELGSNSI